VTARFDARELFRALAAHQGRPQDLADIRLLESLDDGSK
jgi:hypothetical protein